MELSKVNCQYGAPMGRANRDINNAGAVKLHLERVALNSGGYDSGGAYWGLRERVKRKVLCRPIGHPPSKPPIERVIECYPQLYRYWWNGNGASAAERPLIIEGFLSAFGKDDAKAKIRKVYPQAIFYR